MNEDLELVKPMRRADQNMSENNYEGGEGMGNAQLQYFKRESGQGYYSRDNDREPAEKADILALGNLAVKQPGPDDQPDASTDGVAEAVDDTLLMPDEDFEEKKDKRPLAQLRELHDKYAKHKASEMFLQNHREQLRKYVDKRVDFTGEIFFYKNFTYIFHTDNRLAKDGFACLLVKQLIVGDKIDYLPEGDIDVQDQTFQHVKQGTELKYFNIDSGDGDQRSPGKSKSPSKRA